MPDLFHIIPQGIVARALNAAENGRVPDPLLRWGIRRLCAQRAAAERAIGRTADVFASEMLTSAIATYTEAANEQHYEVPTELFRRVLGPNMKYSSCIYPHENASLEEAEEASLALTCKRAGIEDGMSVLDLGCGWGSLTNYIARQYPNCRVTSVSNSATQRAWIEECCAAPNRASVEVVTADAATFDMGKARFDRVVSIEMFEHMRNWGELFDRIARALTPEGKFFLHVFCHHTHPYLFENDGEPDWMARNFFSGGIMPSFDLPGEIKSGLEVEKQWDVNGQHYARTLRAWLDLLDQQRQEIDRIFIGDLGENDGRRAVQRWRMFFMACEELFAFDEGREWFVGHYLLRPHHGPGTGPSSERGTTK